MTPPNLTDRPLVDAVVRSDHARAAALLAGGHDVHERGENEWAALNFAAGIGDLEMVRLLLANGADVFVTGLDRRTPYQIAIAASRAAAARCLKAREEEVGGDRDRISSREWETRPYCKACRLDDVRQYPGWPSADDVRSAGDEFVFIHEDYSVTRSIWRGQDLLLAGDAAEWRAFCESTLGFRVPQDLD